MPTVEDLIKGLNDRRNQGAWTLPRNLDTFHIATFSDRTITPDPVDGPHPKSPPPHEYLIPDDEPPTILYTNALRVELTFNAPAGFSLLVVCKTKGEESRYDDRFSGKTLTVSVAAACDEIIWSVTANNKIISYEHELVINRLIVGLGVATVPCIPVGLIYDVPQVAGHSKPNTSTFSTSITSSTSIAITLSNSKNETTPTNHQLLAGFEKIVSDLGKTTKDLGALLSPGGNSSAGGGKAAQPPGFSEYATAAGDALTAVSDFVTNLWGKVDVSAGNNIKIDDTTNQGTTVTWANMASPQGALGPGHGDLIYYLAGADMLWLVHNGQVTITFVRYKSVSATVDELKNSLARLGVSPVVDPDLGLNAETIRTLLSIDPFVAGGPDVDLGTPELAQRFAPMDSFPTLAGQQMQQYRFTVTLSTQSVKAQTTMNTITQTDQQGLLSYLGLDVGVTDDKTISTSVTNSSSSTAGTQQTDENTAVFYNDVHEHYVVRAYYDSCFGTFAYQLVREGLVKIISRATRMVLDVPGGKASVTIQQKVDNGTRTQQWFMVPVPHGNYYKLESLETGKVLDVPNGDPNVAKIQQYDENVGDESFNQQWQLVPVDGGDYVKIISRATRMVLDVPGGVPTDGVEIQQDLDNGGPNQQWQLVPIF